MSAVRIALLNASYNETNTRRNFRREVPAELVEFDVCRGQLPPSLAFDGAIVTGSRSSVYWDEDWLPAVKEWIDEAAAAGMPLLGICFGHQLLADVLGGTVEDMGQYEIGYRSITHEGNSVLFDEIEPAFSAFTTHSDRVVEVPPNAIVTASNDYGVHGFQAGNVFGVQFHPEYDMKTAAAITRSKDELPESVKRQVLDGITPETYAAAGQAKLVFDNFVDYVAQQQVTSPRVESD